MTNIGNLYIAEKNNVIVRISDNFVMGPGIDLGVNDSIENYTEREVTEEELELFYPKRRMNIELEDNEIGDNDSNLDENEQR